MKRKEPDKQRCAKLHNWKTPKPADDELVCMDCGRKISLASPEDAFKINAIIHRAERLKDAIIQARAQAQARKFQSNRDMPS